MSSIWLGIDIIISAILFTFISIFDMIMSMSSIWLGIDIIISNIEINVNNIADIIKMCYNEVFKRVYMIILYGKEKDGEE